MLPFYTGMAPSAAEVEQARLHVAQAENAVHNQRHRLARLRNGGLPTNDAEKLLATFENTLRVMRAHLDVEESFGGGDATA